MWIRRGAGGLSRAPVFGMAVLAPVLLAGVVAAAPAPVRQPEALPRPAPAPVIPAPTARTAGDLKIPAAALAAYQRTEQTMDSIAPDCGVSWNLLAGVGRIEPSLPDGSRSDTPGIPLAVHADKGPSQLLPAAWSRFPSDGDGDGRADRQDVFDTTLATARYLCSSGMNLRNQAQALMALVHLTNSAPYAESVLGWAETYAAGVTPRTLPPILGSVPPLYVPHPWASEPALPSYTPVSPVSQNAPVAGQPQTGPGQQVPSPMAPAEPQIPDAAPLPPQVLQDVAPPGANTEVPNVDVSDIGEPDAGPKTHLSVQSGGTVRSGH